MNKRPVQTWIIISIAFFAIGWIWSRTDPDNEMAFYLYFFGWISSLLALGFYSTPSNSIYGKIAFGCVIVMVIGIAFKILHFSGGNELIVAGLLGVVVTYAVMWVKQKLN